MFDNFSAQDDVKPSRGRRDISDITDEVDVTVRPRLGGGPPAGSLVLLEIVRHVVAVREQGRIRAFSGSDIKNARPSGDRTRHLCYPGITIALIEPQQSNGVGTV